MRFPLGGDDTYLILSPRWADLGPAWQIALFSLLLLVPLGLIAWLYRYELRLVRGWHAAGLLGLRLVLLAALWAVVILQPTVSHFESEQVPSRVTIAVDLSQSMDVADAQRTSEEADGLARVLGGSNADIATWSRKELVRRVLSTDGLDLVRRLSRYHQVELIGFHESRWDVEPAGLDKLFATDAEKATQSRGTDLRQPFLRGGGTESTPLRGILLFTDGRHNQGPVPLDLARRLGALGIPVYPVAIGSQRPPPDLLLADVQAPGKVFKGTTLPVQVRVKAMHLPAQELTVELNVPGQPAKPEHRQTVKHAGGDAAYELAFKLPMEKSGTHVLSAKVRGSLGGEITLENNERAKVVRVAEDKARVLLVDEEARWEYHYLAAALQRDPTVRLERVLFDPPRIGALTGDDADRAGLPKTRLPAQVEGPNRFEPLNDFDCIVLGDVSPEKLLPAERRRLERYVGERGGTLILVAGKRSLPLAFTSQPDAVNDPLVKLLPIQKPRVIDRKDGFTLRLTAEGKRAPFLQLDPDAGPTGWPDLPNHFWAITGVRQPGATVLMLPAPVTPEEKPPAEDQNGLLVQQNYGFGKVAFLGLDSTWRWRYKVGDTYHHRFWGQLVRWAAADRLLPAGNRFVRYGTREPVYAHGQEIELAARLSEDAPPLKDSANVRATIFRLKADNTTEAVASVPLKVNAQQTKLLEGKLRELPPGAYRVDLDISELRDAAAPEEKESAATFQVLPPENTELLDLSTNWELLQAIADQSSGRLFTPESVEQLLELLDRQARPKETREDSKLWQDEPFVWWALGLIVGLLTAEWLWRKALELP